MKTALIVDDSIESREFLREVLETSGYTVFEAADGEEAVRTAVNATPQLIICDIQMPLLDGYAAISRIRHHPVLRATPVIALTAYAMPGDREKALAAGFTSYLSKPIRISDLRAELVRIPH
jgi:two-component system cell cycle response regulator DivK